MMIYIVKIILFVLVNLGGYFAIPILMNIAIKLDFYPELPPGEISQEFAYYFLQVGAITWLIAAAASIGYFFTRNRELKTWLILAPLYVPSLYGLGIILYYNYFVTS